MPCLKQKNDRKLSQNELNKVVGGKGKGCVYADKEYKDGDTIKLPDDSTQTCSNGSWV